MLIFKAGPKGGAHPLQNRASEQGAEIWAEDERRKVDLLTGGSLSGPDLFTELPFS